MLTSSVVIVSCGPVLVGNMKEFCNVIVKVLGYVVVFRVGWFCISWVWKEEYFIMY